MIRIWALHMTGEKQIFMENIDGRWTNNRVGSYFYEQ